MPGMGSITGDLRSSHASATCDGVACNRPGDARHGPARLREITRQEWEPRDEGDARALAMIEHLLRRRCRAALDEVVPVLHRDDRHELASPLDVRHGHLRQSNVTDLALVLQLAQRAQLILERDSGIDAVQLV